MLTVSAVSSFKCPKFILTGDKETSPSYFMIFVFLLPLTCWAIMFLVTEPSPDTTLTDELKIDLTAFDREGIFGRFFLQVASVLVL